MREDLVSISVKEGTFTNSKATLIFVNNTNQTYIYGEPYSIEKEENGIWYELNPIIDDYGFNLPAYYLNSNESKEKSYDWEWLYGKLKPGKYRTVTYVFLDLDRPITESDYVYIAAEFTIK